MNKGGFQPPKATQMLLLNLTRKSRNAVEV